MSRSRERTHSEDAWDLNTAENLDLREEKQREILGEIKFKILFFIVRY
jgi:hypothetical protein